jgi:hypothetical protein
MIRILRQLANNLDVNLDDAVQKSDMQLNPSSQSRFKVHPQEGATPEVVILVKLFINDDINDEKKLQRLPIIKI